MWPLPIGLVPRGQRTNPDGAASQHGCHSEGTRPVSSFGQPDIPTGEFRPVAKADGRWRATSTLTSGLAGIPDLPYDESSP